MAIITISRGTFAGGRHLAQALGERMGYPSMSRELLAQVAEQYGLSQEKLIRAMEKPPSFWEQMMAHRADYLNYVRAVLCDQARSGNLVYEGHLGHLLLNGIKHVIRVRVIADMEFRIKSAMERMNLERRSALAYIRHVDEERARLTRFLYGVDWSDPSLFDVVLNLERMGVASACEVVVRMTELPEFQPTDESRRAMEDLTLGSRVWATLARDPRTAGAHVQVTAHSGVVAITGSAGSQHVVDSIVEVAEEVDGVKQVTSEVGMGADWYW